METATGITIRPAVANDAVALHEVFVSAVWGIDDSIYNRSQKQAWQDVIKADSWSTRLLEDSYIVAEQNEKVVGFAAWSANRLEHFYVAAEHSRQGTGSALLFSVLDHFKDKEIDLIASDNAESIYARFGFVAEDRFMRQLGPVEVSCIRMKRQPV